MPEAECWTCDICIRRLPVDGIPVPKHVGMTLIMSCVYDNISLYYVKSIIILVNILNIRKCTV